MQTKYKTILLSLFPAIIFIATYRLFSFKHAIFVGFSVGTIIYVTKYIRNNRLSAFDYLGILGLVGQTIISLISGNPQLYFMYPLIENIFFAFIFGLSLLFGKDVTSYIARDFNGAEDPQKDCTPAYRKITFIWMVYFILKAIIKLVGITNWDFEVLYSVNWLLSTPIGILLIWISFSYPEKYYIKNFGKGDTKHQENENVSDIT